MKTKQFLCNTAWKTNCDCVSLCENWLLTMHFEIN
jgi:hypothetical protein